ncbi:MAG: FeS-binding protein [Actinobacteria bacterium]|nr:MAG: FeS-binding protein [Actinomycetota bacterium]
MASLKVHIIFPEELIKEPVIYNLAKSYNVVTNIRKANVDSKVGWVDLEIDGTEEDIQKGIRYMESLGVDVEPIEGDILEG